MYWSRLKINKLLFILLFFLHSCDMIKMKKEPEESNEQSAVIARAYDNNLYEHDIKGIVSENVSKQDSANIISRYVNNWIRKQLLIHEAASKIDFDQAELERKILDYRYALMVYEYEKYYIDQTLDKTVTEEEIKEYYNQNIANFELKQNIIRGIFVKVPKEAPKIDKLKKLIVSNKSKDIKDLRSYCFRFATSYSLDDSLWVNFDEVIKNTPLMGIPNKVQFLKENDFIESEDQDYLYFIKIHEYKISDERPPLEFVKDEIENIIINRRKIKLSNELEEKIYNKAKENNDFKIYSSN